MPIKGREIEATVLFADITSFSSRTADLDPAETLAFVNHFLRGFRLRHSATGQALWTSTSGMR